MARYGSPDDQNNYSDEEPTQLSNYGAYDEPPPPPGDTPWYRKPAALVALGAVGALLIALIVYGLAKAITGDSTSDPTTTATLTPGDGHRHGDAHDNHRTRSDHHHDDCADHHDDDDTADHHHDTQHVGQHEHQHRHADRNRDIDRDATAAGRARALIPGGRERATAVVRTPF